MGTNKCEQYMYESKRNHIILHCVGVQRPNIIYPSHHTALRTVALYPSRKEPNRDGETVRYRSVCVI